MFRRLIATTRTWTPLPLRLSVGLLFVLHGAEKVFGFHGGPGLSAWMANEKYANGLRPAWFWLGAAAFFELIGGILILAGLLIRIGALLVIPVMLVAIYGSLSSAHSGPLPLWQIGYPLAMLGSAIALFITGGGHASIDETLTRSRRRYLK